LTGVIIKGIGGYYYVESEGEIYTCRARGKFREEKLKPMIGDRVEFDPPTQEQSGYLMRILPRKNTLRRPPVSNVDVLMITIAASKPQPDLLLCDRLLASSEMMDIEKCIIVNKCDAASTEEVEELKAQYSAFNVFAVSAHSGSGVQQLKEYCSGKTVCFAGQSAVGKTSLINVISPYGQLEVGDLSRKTQRGKHTTRHAELLRQESEGYVVDTPGFSMFDLEMMDPVGLKDLYPEFKELNGTCRYQSCVHNKEPGCSVKAAVEEGKIAPQRYERYIKIYEMIREEWSRRYE